MRKPESCSIEELVGIFCTKWNLKVKTIKEKELPIAEVLFKKYPQIDLPIIIELAEVAAKGRYIILWKNRITENSYHYDVLSKSTLINPQNHYDMFKLCQLKGE